jgi:hypothetical protein
MPSPPTNISSVTNPKPAGDPDFYLKDGTTPQTLGQRKETDEELRERHFESTTIGGSATVNAVKEQITSLEARPSIRIYTNRELTDNANGNGLPKLSTELVIHKRGASDEEIAEAIHSSISVGERLVNGINGTGNSYTVTDTALAQDRTLVWSEPSIIQLDITVDVVTEAGYQGDDAVKETIAEYIGGTAPDGGAVAGLDVNEDVIVDELERRVNGLEGVIGVASVTIDDNDDGSDDTVTRGDGLQAYEVGTNKVAKVDATQNITVN